MKYKGKWEVCLYLLQKSIVLLWCKICRRFVFTLWIWVVIADPKNCKLKLKNKNSRQQCVFKWCLFCFCISHSSSWNKYFIALQREQRKLNKRKTKRKKVPWPGFEPGLLRPQRSVLTTRRSRQRRKSSQNVLDLISNKDHLSFTCWEKVHNANKLLGFFLCTECVECHFLPFPPLWNKTPARIYS